MVFSVLFLTSLFFSKFQDNDNQTSVRGVSPNWSTNIIYTHYYKVWSNLIVTTIIPLIILIFCNVGIFLTLKKSQKSMSGSRGGHSSSSSNPVSNGNGGGCVTSYSASSVYTNQKNENGLALILIGIVLVFMVCHACRFFLAIYHK